MQGEELRFGGSYADDAGRPLGEGCTAGTGIDEDGCHAGGYMGGTRCGDVDKRRSSVFFDIGITMPGCKDGKLDEIGIMAAFGDMCRFA